jgi:hypothetical protein
MLGGETHRGRIPEQMLVGSHPPGNTIHDNAYFNFLHKKLRFSLKDFFTQTQSFRISHNHENFPRVLPAIARSSHPYHDQCGKNLRATHFPMSLAKGFARKPRTHR